MVALFFCRCFFIYKHHVILHHHPYRSVLSHNKKSKRYGACPAMAPPAGFGPVACRLGGRLFRRKTTLDNAVFPYNIKGFTLFDSSCFVSNFIFTVRAIPGVNRPILHHRLAPLQLFPWQWNEYLTILHLITRNPPCFDELHCPNGIVTVLTFHPTVCLL